MGVAPPSNGLLTIFLLGLLSTHPDPAAEGCLISVSRRGAGSGGRLRGVGDAAPNPSRRSKPLRPGAPSVRHGAPLTAADGTVRRAGHRLGRRAVDRQPHNPRGEAGCLKGQSTGGDAEQTSNTARGTPGKRRTCGFLPDFDKPRCREASRSVGPSIFVCAHCVNLSAPGTLAFRAPSVLSGQRLAAPKPKGRRRAKVSSDGLPGAAKEHGR